MFHTCQLYYDAYHRTCNGVKEVQITYMQLACDGVVCPLPIMPELLQLAYTNFVTNLWPWGVPNKDTTCITNVRFTNSICFTVTDSVFGSSSNPWTLYRAAPCDSNCCAAYVQICYDSVDKTRYISSISAIPQQHTCVENNICKPVCSIFQIGLWPVYDWRHGGDTVVFPLSGLKIPAPAESVFSQGRARVKPNPADNTVTISYKAETPGDLNLTLYDMRGGRAGGQRRVAGKAGDLHFVVNVSHLPPGSYRFDIQNGSGTVANGMFVVQR